MNPDYHVNMPRQFTLPLEFYGDTPFLRGTLNGNECLFLVDSGAQDIMLNARHVDDTGAVREKVGIGATGAAVTFFTQIEELAFGDWRFGHREVLAMDMGHIEEEYKVEFHGLFGFRQLIHYDWMADYRGKQLHLFSRFDKKEHKIAASVRTQYFSHLPSFEVTIAGHPFKLLLDTGAPEFVFETSRKELVEPVFKSRGMETLDSASPIKVEVEAGTLSGFQIGDLEFGETVVKFMDLSNLRKYLGEFDGIIGYGMLSQCRAVVGWNSKAIWVLED